MTHPSTPEKTMEQGNGNPNGIAYNHEEDRQGDLDRFRTAGSVAMSPELFEKLYLTPLKNVHGDLRKTFANPTPIALVGFLIALTPLSCDLMGWAGAGGGGAASSGFFVFMGGLLMFTGGVLEWVLGNTFASVVFCTFGGFYFSYGATLLPSFNTSAAYAPADGPASAGAATPGFNASLAFVFLFMGVLCFLFLVCSLRTNVVFVVIFLSLMLAFFFLTGGYMALASDFTGNADKAGKLIIGGGACAFVCAMTGWYLLTAQMLDVVDFPFGLPVGDLSGIVKGRSERAAAKN
ncbi:unnamed protein product [Clonostachys byssicola]|uniref:Protein alcS n=1 Tax=Clonostachys byssicola TaxID=160290 RepID=A0A9N9UTC9_9HYPO|nr:unnamed protein product [Clonostachys byssicola]